jgi:hypothetical protein
MVVAGNFRAELRKKRRRQFSYSAKIITHGKQRPRSCTISDISETGARLALDSDDELPDCFVLLLTASGGARRPCRVAWRAGLTIGVEFTGG